MPRNREQKENKSDNDRRDRPERRGTDRPERMERYSDKTGDEYDARKGGTQSGQSFLQHEQKDSTRRANPIERDPARPDFPERSNRPERPAANNDSRRGGGPIQPPDYRRPVEESDLDADKDSDTGRDNIEAGEPAEKRDKRKSRPEEMV